jgi:hypothetical protein
MCIFILRHLRGAVRRKWPQKLRVSSWFILHSNAPAHRSVFVKHFLTKNNVTTREYPQHSPDLGPAEFYLLPRQNSNDGAAFLWSNWLHWTEELKMPKWFPEMRVASLLLLAKMCSCTRGLFLRKCSLTTVLSIYFSGMKWYRERTETTKYK